MLKEFETSDVVNQVLCPTLPSLNMLFPQRTILFVFLRGLSNMVHISITMKFSSAAYFFSLVCSIYLNPLKPFEKKVTTPKASFSKNYWKFTKNLLYHQRVNFSGFTSFKCQNTLPVNIFFKPVLIFLWVTSQKPLVVVVLLPHQLCCTKNQNVTCTQA